MGNRITHFLADMDTTDSPDVPDRTQIEIDRIATVTDHTYPQGVSLWSVPDHYNSL